MAFPNPFGNPADQSSVVQSSSRIASRSVSSAARHVATSAKAPTPTTGDAPFYDPYGDPAGITTTGVGPSQTSSAGGQLGGAPTDQDIVSFWDKETPNRIWYALAVLIATISILQLLSWLHSKFFVRASKSRAVKSIWIEDGIPPRRHGMKISRFPLALVNLWRVVAFRLTLNIGRHFSVNIAEMLLVAGYIALIFGYAFANTTSVTGELWKMRYWSNRCGDIAASQFPLIVALASKNNIIGLIVGVGWEKINFLHRMVARTIFILLWFHIAAKIIHGDAAADISEMWLILGILAMAAFTAIVFLSLRPIRAKAYEFFLFIHITMAVIVLVGAFYHTANFDLQIYIWPAIAIWAFDRLIRTVRTWLFNQSYFGMKTGQTMEGKTELLSEHLVRLTIRRPPRVKWTPGQYAYLTIPSVSNFPFEQHPFSIASLPNEITSAGNWNEMVFLINVRGGFTNKLHDFAARRDRVKVYVDGPYGCLPSSHGFDTLILIAGGSGISYTLPVLLDTIERARGGDHTCSKVVFVWSVRNIDHIQWISDELSKSLANCPPSLLVEILIHLTSWDASESSESLPSSPDEFFPSSSIGKQNDMSRGTFSSQEKPRKRYPEHISVLNQPQCKVTKGRCNLRTFLSEEAQLTNGRMAVRVCGAQALAADVRRALQFPANIAGIMRGDPSISLHVEQFGY